MASGISRTVASAIVLLAALCAAVGPGSVQASADRAEQLMKTAAQLEGNVRRGEALYRTQCSSCHGKDAHGNAAALVPALAGQRRAYLVKQFADFSELDRIATQMHVVVARADVSEPQAWVDLALYLNTQTPVLTPQVGNGDWAALGEASYRQFCASCHEEDARGDDDGYVPSLRNQHYAYLLQEMRSLSRGHRFNVEPDLARFLDSLKADEMSGIADYLSRLRGQVRDRARLLDDGTVSN